MTLVQHQREVSELIENVNQKTYAYRDVRSKNQDLLMTISKLKAKLKSTEKGKNVNRVASSSNVSLPWSKDSILKKRVVLHTK
ncbi:hypothetical protein Tco_1541000 [Tanacetum coccineum]